jgi:hypothetical protein
VFHELKGLETRSKQLGQPFPLVMFHDVGWPYGRRDMYYNPDNIPFAHRQQFQRRGMKPGQSALLPRGGWNVNVNNALAEGTPRNGVMTAIEDYFKETSLPLHFHYVPGIQGFGVLYTRDLRQQNAALGQFLQSLELAPHMRDHVERLERARVDLMMAYNEQRRMVLQLQQQLQGKTP